MNNVTLKSAASITALVNVADTPDTKVLQKRRQYLAGRVQAAGLELPQVLPVLMSQAQSKDEAAFIRSLVEVQATTSSATPGEQHQEPPNNKPQYMPETEPVTHQS